MKLASSIRRDKALYRHRRRGSIDVFVALALVLLLVCGGFAIFTDCFERCPRWRSCRRCQQNNNGYCGLYYQCQPLPTGGNKGSVALEYSPNNGVSHAALSNTVESDASKRHNAAPAG